MLSQERHKEYLLPNPQMEPTRIGVRAIMSPQRAAHLQRETA
jgi:hypothetical protein